MDSIVVGLDLGRETLACNVCIEIELPEKDETNKVRLTSLIPCNGLLLCRYPRLNLSQAFLLSFQALHSKVESKWLLLKRHEK